MHAITRSWRPAGSRWHNASHRPQSCSWRSENEVSLNGRETNMPPEHPPKYDRTRVSPADALAKSPSRSRLLPSWSRLRGRQNIRHVRSLLRPTPTARRRSEELEAQPARRPEAWHRPCRVMRPLSARAVEPAKRVAQRPKWGVPKGKEGP